MGKLKLSHSVGLRSRVPRKDLGLGPQGAHKEARTVAAALPTPGSSRPLAGKLSSVLASARVQERELPLSQDPLVALATCLISFYLLSQHPAGQA